METIEKRQKLHEYIDIADDEKVNALFTILESVNDNNYQYSTEGINMFYERREQYLNGEGKKKFSIEEVFDEVRTSISPKVSELTGVIKLPKNFEYKKELGKILSEKYGM